MSASVYVHCVLVVCTVGFVKQKTAYEVRISDWSSDVCSSDLSQSIYTTSPCRAEWPVNAASDWRTSCQAKKFWRCRVWRRIGHIRCLRSWKPMSEASATGRRSRFQARTQSEREIPTIVNSSPAFRGIPLAGMTSEAMATGEAKARRCLVEGVAATAVNTLLENGGRTDLQTTNQNTTLHFQYTI